MERHKVDKELYVLEILSSDAYLVLNKKLLQHYGPDVAVFLSNLIDKYRYFKRKNDLLDGKWFYLIHEQQIEQTGLTIEKIRTCKKTLKHDNILQTDRKGIPSKEYYCLDFDRIMEVIPLTASPRESLQQAIGLDQQLYNNNKLNNNISVPNKVSDSESVLKNKKPSKKERSQAYIPLAEQLSEIVQSVKNIKHTKVQIQTWAYSICQLVEDVGVERRRIRRVLNWYEKHVGEPYIPVIESGASLKEKFIRLEAAMQREQSPTQVTSKCPNGWAFGKSFNGSKQGCMECEDASPKLYNQCKLLKDSLRGIQTVYKK